MAEQITNGGRGVSIGMHVNENESATVFAVTESEASQAAEEGNGYNINTGTIALTGTGTSGLLYFKNDEDFDFVVTAIAVGMGTRSATITDAANVTIIRNPTGGTVVSDASVVAMSSNNNFGSSNALKSTTLAYAASATGKTITGGTDHALIYMTDGRLLASLDIELPKGSAVGVEIDLNTSGGANVYCALIGYVKDPKNK